MKRVLAIITVITLVFALTCCGGRETQPTDVPKDETVLKFAEQWKMYLKAQDDMYSCVKTAYESAQIFTMDKAWDSLTDAAMTASVAATYLAESEGLEIIMTDEDFDYLVDCGLDVSFVPVVLENVAVLYGDEAVSCKKLYGKLSSVYTEDEFELLGESIKNKLDNINCLAKYACAEASYVVNDIGDAEIAQDIKDYIVNECPMIAAGIDFWSENEAAAMENVDTALDEFELVITEEKNIRGREEGILQEYGEIIKYPLEIKDMPELLPMPSWYDPYAATVSYIIREGSGVTVVQNCDKELLSRVTGCIIVCENVSEEQLTEYNATLAEMGYGKAEDYAVDIKYSDNKAYITLSGEKMCFAPQWYLNR